jgi:hypothetical protein
VKRGVKFTRSARRLRRRADGARSREPSAWCAWREGGQGRQAEGRRELDLLLPVPPDNSRPNFAARAVARTVRRLPAARPVRAMRSEVRYERTRDKLKALHQASRRSRAETRSPGRRR